MNSGPVAVVPLDAAGSARDSKSLPPRTFRAKTFRAFGAFNYRLWAAGALVSNIGTWMQRTAQDWLVLTQLTPRNATAMGVVMALQFGPQVALLPLTGWAADRFDRRKLLLATQGAMGLLALGLGLLTVTGQVRLWQVNLFALLLGCVSAFDAPARQTFVSDLVGEDDLSNAVALNATSFHVARMLGPAAAGALMSVLSPGWVFLINAASFAAVLLALGRLRKGELRPRRGTRLPGGFAEGFRYIWGRRDLKAILVMLFLFGTFGLNFPIFIAAMAVKVFQRGAGNFGLLTSVMAAGSVAGALLSARRERPRFAILLWSGTFFGVALLAAALLPSYFAFALSLTVVGIAAQTFTTTSNSTMQLATEPLMRGRVMAIFLAVAMGGTPIGAPIVGWVADHFGARWSLVVGAAGGLAAAAIGLVARARGAAPHARA